MAGSPIPLSTLQATSRDVSRKTQGQDGVAVSFLVGLFHSLPHAGLSRSIYRRSNEALLQMDASATNRELTASVEKIRRGFAPDYKQSRHAKQFGHSASGDVSD